MPNSMLLIGLVVLWLFVLFPLLAARHPRVRQTTDAALATRVLFRGGAKRRAAKSAATGHDTDPDWRPVPLELRKKRSTDAEDPMDARVDETSDTELDDSDPEFETGDAGFEERDADFEAERPRRAAPRGSDWTRARVDESAEFVPNRRGRGGFDPQADAIARAARYAFRQRAVLGLLLASVMTGALGLIVSPKMWWACGAAFGILVLYLCYLRKQVRMEEEIRRRRMARLGRSRLGVESSTDEELRLVPARLRRPGAVVLECDDEDPIFEHLDHPDVAVSRSGDSRGPRGMQRAAGE